MTNAHMYVGIYVCMKELNYIRTREWENEQTDSMNDRESEEQMICLINLNRY